MIIGVPKETKDRENRVALTPEMTRSLIAEGYKVKVEAGGGINSDLTDEDYAEAGASIDNDRAGIFSGSDVILTVNQQDAVAWKAAGIPIDAADLDTDMEAVKYAVLPVVAYPNEISLLKHTWLDGWPEF